MSGQREDRNVVGDTVALEVAGGCPAVHYGQAHVEQDQIGWTISCGIGAGLTTDGYDDVMPAFDESSRQHAASHLVVFDQEFLCHRAGED